MQRELGALTSDAEKKEQGADEQQVVADAAGQGEPVQDGDVKGPMGGVEERDDAQHQADVADTGGDEGLDGRRRVDLLLPPVADEHERAHADQFPPDEKLQGVGRHHQHQHRRREQRQRRVEVGEATVAVHVAERVHVHHQRHERDDEQHHHGQAVDVRPGVDGDPAHLEPGHVALDRVARRVHGDPLVGGAYCEHE